MIPLRSRGAVLWLRHQGVPGHLAVCLLGATAIRLVVTVLVEDGGGVDVAPLWTAVVAILPLLFMLTGETDVERAAPRPVGRRRLALLGIAVLVAWLVGLSGLPDEASGQGAVATWRDEAALLGLGLLSLTILSDSAVWVAPVVAALASMMFSLPLYPGLLHGVWGALRAPSGLVFGGGAVNLSIPVCLLVGTAGAVCYVAGAQVRPVPVRRGSPRPATPVCSRPAHSGKWGQGLRRAGLEIPLGVLVAVVMAWVCVSDLRSWGGSPRLLLAETLPGSAFIAVGCAVVLGVVLGQARWRAGVAIWQRLSGRRMVALLARAVGRAAGVAVAWAGAPVLLLAVVSAADVSRWAGPAVGLGELSAGGRPALLVLAEVAVGAALGACAGWLTGRVWVAPLCLVLTVAAMIPAPRPDAGDVEGLSPARYGDMSCTAVRVAAEGSVRVCAAIPNAGYLDAAGASVAGIYSASAHPEALPPTVLVTNSGTMGEVRRPAQGLPDVGLRGSRGFVPPLRLAAPGSLSSEDPRSSLSYSTHAWCRGTRLFDLQMLYGAEEYAPTPTMDRTLDALRGCR